MMAGQPLLKVDGLVKRFGGLLATDHAHLAVEAGELHALIDPNGAGKTTLIHQLSGSLAPSAGTVACGAAVPTAARSSITCSYCWAKRPAATHSGRPDSRPMRCSRSGSTPRSAQRASRSRSSVANPAVLSAGRRCAGQPEADCGPSARSPASRLGAR